MKTTVMLILLFLAPIAGQAQRQLPEVPKGMIVIRMENGRLKAEDVYLLAVTKAMVAYKANPANAAPVVLPRAEVDSIFLYEPRDYLEALDLYEGREYAKAKRAFALVRERYGRAYPGLPNNPGVMAGFYEMECLRKLSDLEGLRTTLKDFGKDGLTNPVALQQLELYELWDAIRAKRNKEALSLAERYNGVRLPGDQRAQVAYCRARAMEELAYPDHETLLAYQTAITADFGASEVISRDAILRVLGIIHNNEQVGAAIRAFEVANGREMFRGFRTAMDAAGLCVIYQKQFGAEEPLPAQYRHFLRYTPDRVERRRREAGVIE